MLEGHTVVKCVQASGSACQGHIGGGAGVSRSCWRVLSVHRRHLQTASGTGRDIFPTSWLAFMAFVMEALLTSGALLGAGGWGSRVSLSILQAGRERQRGGGPATRHAAGRGVLGRPDGCTSPES